MTGSKKFPTDSFVTQISNTQRKGESRVREGGVGIGQDKPPSKRFQWLDRVTPLGKIAPTNFSSIAPEAPKPRKQVGTLSAPDLPEERAKVKAAKKYWRTPA